MTRSLGLKLREAFDEAGDGVGGFERGDDAFGAREEACGFECGVDRRRRRIRRGLRSASQACSGPMAG